MMGKQILRTPEEISSGVLTKIEKFLEIEIEKNQLEFWELCLLYDFFKKLHQLQTTSLSRKEPILSSKGSLIVNRVLDFIEKDETF